MNHNRFCRKCGATCGLVIIDQNNQDPMKICQKCLGTYNFIKSYMSNQLSIT